MESMEGEMNKRFSNRVDLAEFLYDALGFVTDPYITWEMVYNATPGTLGIGGRYEDINDETLRRIMHEVWESLGLGDWPFGEEE